MEPFTINAESLPATSGESLTEFSEIHLMQRNLRNKANAVTQRDPATMSLRQINIEAVQAGCSIIISPHTCGLTSAAPVQDRRMKEWPEGTTKTNVSLACVTRPNCRSRDIAPTVS